MGSTTVTLPNQFLSGFDFPAFANAMFVTLRLAAITTAILVAFGIPLAHWLNASRRFVARVTQVIVGLPVVLPPTVIGFYLLVAFNPTRAPGSWWLQWRGEALSFSFVGLVVGSILYSLPYAVQPFQAALAAVPQSMVEAAAAAGAPPWRAFLRVRVPLARRGLLVGAALAFAHTIGEFGVVMMIGGNIPGKTRVASMALYDAAERADYPTAHLYAIVLLVGSAVLLSVVNWLQRRSA